MKLNRQRIIEILTLTIISLLIYINCWPTTAIKDLSSTEGADVTSQMKDQKKEQFNSLMSSYQDKIILLQSKFIIGLSELSKDITSTPELNQQAFKFGDEDLKKMVSAFVISFTENAEIIKPTTLQFARYLSIAKYFKHNELETSLCAKLRETSTNSPTPLSLLLVNKCESGAALSKVGAIAGAWQLTTQDRIILHDELQWFGDLLVYSAETENSAEKNKLYEEIISPTKGFAFSFALFIGLFAMGFTFSIIALPIIFIQLLLGKFKFRLTKSIQAAPYFLELFALYLGGMLLVGKVLGKLDLNLTPGDMLRLNIVIISSLGIFSLWPLLFQIRFHDLYSCLGLPNLLPHKFIYEVFIGIFSYVVYIPVMLFVLAIYSLILNKLNIDPSSGTHPIVPLVTGSDAGGENIFNLVFILAVCVAPIIEELMFRGAFYGWLRSRLSSFLAIFISALIFAAVHPQGAIGILPLTCIGVLLAFLREWRGSLTASMTAHACNNALMLTAVNYLFR